MPCVTVTTAPLTNPPPEINQETPEPATPTFARIVLDIMQVKRASAASRARGGAPFPGAERLTKREPAGRGAPTSEPRPRPGPPAPPLPAVPAEGCGPGARLAGRKRHRRAASAITPSGPSPPPSAPAQSDSGREEKRLRPRSLLPAHKFRPRIPVPGLVGGVCPSGWGLAPSAVALEPGESPWPLARLCPYSVGLSGVGHRAGSSEDERQSLLFPALPPQRDAHGVGVLGTDAKRKKRARPASRYLELGGWVTPFPADPSPQEPLVLSLLQSPGLQTQGLLAEAQENLFGRGGKTRF